MSLNVIRQFTKLSDICLGRVGNEMRKSEVVFNTAKHLGMILGFSLRWKEYFKKESRRQGVKYILLVDGKNFLFQLFAYYNKLILYRF